MKLIDHLAGSCGISRSKAKKLLDDRVVFVNGRRVWIASYGIGKDDKVEVIRHDQPPAPSQIKILHEDDEFVIVDKPAGLISEGTKSVESVLSAQLGRKVMAVHRLDRDTSGVMALAFTEETINMMKEVFKDKAVKKTYLGLVAGRFPGKTMTITKPLEGRPAKTEISLLATNGIISLLEIGIETGRTHQIRKHLAGMGIALLGEKEYSKALLRKEAFKLVARQMLHARRLCFRNPVTGMELDIRSDLPADFMATIRTFKLETGER